MNAIRKQSLTFSRKRLPGEALGRCLKACILLLIVITPLGSAAGQANALASATPLNGAVKYSERVHQGDVIEVDVVGSYEFDWRGPLDPEGFLDGIGRTSEPIFGRCRTTEEIAAQLTEEYKKFLREPAVEVRILNRNGRAMAYIDGAIKSPFRLRIRREVTLRELIVLSGGFTDNVGGSITVFRPDGASCFGTGTESESREARASVVRIADLLANVDGADRVIVPGDVVTVVESVPVYVMGGVGAPQKISAREGITLSRAIDSAGGTLKKADLEKVSIFRRVGSRSSVIVSNLKRIRDGSDPDPSLEANDIVDVPLKGSPGRRFPPVVDLPVTRRREMPIRIID